MHQNPSPDVTPRYTEGQPRGTWRRRSLALLKAAALAVVLVYAAQRIIAAWNEAGAAEPLDLQPAPWTLLLASVAVLAAYAVLIQTWRSILGTWGDRLGFLAAARIWFISNLWKNVPGKLWQIGAMAMMSRRAQVSPTAAGGSAILSVAVNIATGLGIALFFGRRELDAMLQGYASAAVLLALAAAAIALLPVYLPALGRGAERLTGRSFGPVTVSYRALLIAVGGNLVAWTIYGMAFRAFCIGIVGSAAMGSAGAYIVVWAVSYVIGYLFIFVPAGLGVRETALITALTAFGLANPQEAVIISLTSRLWLTVLEILPGLIFLALRPRQRPNDGSPAAPASPSEKLAR